MRGGEVVRGGEGGGGVGGGGGVRGWRKISWRRGRSLSSRSRRGSSVLEKGEE